MITGTAASVSSELTPAYGGANLADGDKETSWSTTAQETPEPESVVMDLGAVFPLSELRIWPDATLAHLFPVGLTVRVSVDMLQWSTVYEDDDIVAVPDVAIDTIFPVTAARYVEVTATELSREDNGYYYAVIAEVEAVHAQSEPGTVVVTWTATGDDDQDGTATSCHLRYSTCPFDDASAISVQTYAPKESGEPELARIDALASGTFCIALSAIDDASNESDISNIVQIIIP